MESYLLLFGAALVGSALNAVAGGGSFFTFPALLLAGTNVLAANATSTFALWPGAISSAYTYRNQLQVGNRPLLALGLASVLGSILGTYLLLRTPSDLLEDLLPVLIGSATLLLAFKAQLRPRHVAPTAPGTSPLTKVVVFQFFIAIYGGYFGGGMGILMLAALGLMGFQQLVQMNALKTFLGAAINSIAVILFVLDGQIVWHYAIVMVVGGILGGYGGAYWGSKIPAQYLHYFILAVGTFFTIWFALN